jgi:hypothetical protein
MMEKKSFTSWSPEQQAVQEEYPSQVPMFKTFFFFFAEAATK